MKKLLVILVFSYITYVVFTTSCANPGMPTGGDKDTIPPVVLKTVPDLNMTNYKGNSVSFTFNEFVISDEVGTTLLVSPPVAKKPVVRTKSKTLTIELGDSLRQNVTYTLDFGDAIADNNEKNPLEDFRFAFSTGPQFDSLMVGGYVLDAGNMEPVAEAMVLLYDEADSVSSFRKKIPKYIARTDDEGFYTFTNLSGGKYHLFALEDADGSLSYNQTGERIAFFDSLVTPLYPEILGTVNIDSMRLAEIADSLKTEVDSLQAGQKSLSKKVKPDNPASHEMIVPAGLDVDSISPGRQAQKTTMVPHYLLMFKEITFDNFLDNYTRDQKNQVKLYFSNSVTDSFRVNLLSPQPVRTDWSYMEFSHHRDSVSLWINDTVVSQTDTLKLQVKYETLDTLSQRTIVSDTLNLIYSEPVKKERKRKDKDEAPVNTNFLLQVNAKDGFDSYAPLVIQSPVPIDVFDYSKIHVYQKIDTVEQALSVKVEQDSILRRKFLIHHPWEFEGSYRLEIDSAAARAFTGEVSAPVDQSFKVQKEDFYGIIVADIKQTPGNCIVQLLKNSENEEVLKEAFINKDGKVEFSFVKPEKYKLRLIVDRNQDGRWNTGEFDEWKQPERVVYFSKILKVKSNFKEVESWVLPADLHTKKVIDEEQDAKDKKDKTGKKGQKQKKSPRKNNF
ncbi:MAG: Ig-like domain-containing protein [Prolixibacteraceae bacterium]